MTQNLSVSIIEALSQIDLMLLPGSLHISLVQAMVADHVQVGA